MANQPFQFGSGTAAANTAAGNEVKQESDNVLNTVNSGGSLNSIENALNNWGSGVQQAQATPTNYGGYANGANDAANAFNQQGQLSAAVNQPQIAADQGYGNIGLGLTSLTAAGYGPAQQAAAAQLAQGTTNALRTGAALANSARGGGPGLAAAQASAGQSAVNTVQDAGNQAAQLRAQMAANAQNNLVTGATAQQGVNQSGATGQAGIIQGAEGLANNAELGQAQTVAGVYGTQQAANTAQDQLSAGQQNAVVGGLTGLGSAGLGVIAHSDVRNKESVMPADGGDNTGVKAFSEALKGFGQGYQGRRLDPAKENEILGARAAQPMKPPGSRFGPLDVQGKPSLREVMQNPRDSWMTQGIGGQPQAAPNGPPPAPYAGPGFGMDNSPSTLQSGAYSPDMAVSLPGAPPPPAYQGPPPPVDPNAYPVHGNWWAQQGWKNSHPGQPITSDERAKTTIRSLQEGPPAFGHDFNSQGRSLLSGQADPNRAYNTRDAYGFVNEQYPAGEWGGVTPIGGAYPNQRDPYPMPDAIHSDENAKQQAYYAGHEDGQRLREAAATERMRTTPRPESDYGSHEYSDDGSRLREAAAARRMREHQGQPSEADHFLASLKPYSYKYKDPSMEPTSQPNGGRYLGVMAQNVERSPVGPQIVKDTPRGKVLEGPALQSAMAAGLGRLHERVAQLEAMRQQGKPDSRETLAQRPGKPEDERTGKQ